MVHAARLIPEKMATHHPAAFFNSECIWRNAMRVIDLTGSVIGRWTAESRGENLPNGQTRWWCICECGTRKLVSGIVLRDKRSQSCGCLQSELTVKRSTKHGHSPMRGKISPTYHSWCGMIARCTNPGHGSYARYGGRGISVCEPWLDFANFLADMGEKPKGASIDRVDTNGNYEPSNCRWATAKEQGRNKRNNRLLTYQGETLCLQEWAERLGIRGETIWGRLDTGWSVNDALSTPDGTSSNNVRSRMLTLNGETHHVREWARILHINEQVIYQRLHRGADDAAALRPPRKRSS